jgi:hypothetical protein
MLEKRPTYDSQRPYQSGRGFPHQQGRGFPGRSYAGRGGIHVAGRGPNVSFGENKYLGEEKIQINVVPNPTGQIPGDGKPAISEGSGLAWSVLQGAERAHPGN